MNFRETITPDAALDLARAVDWYDSQEPGVGEKFYLAFREKLEQILESPLSPRPHGRRKIRKVNLYKFPYGIYYEVVEHQVRVLAVIHGARDPKYVGYRLRGAALKL